MSLFYKLFLLGNILFIFISLNNAISLYDSCTDTTPCTGTGEICRGTCQCDTPWYTPCNMTICNPKEGFVYEGETCRATVNCVKNAECDSNQQCRCTKDFTAINGLCFKSINSPCGNDAECWSGACPSSTCQCKEGFIPREDNNRCKRKLAKLYKDFAAANLSNDFCYDTDSNGCQTQFAVCQNDSINSGKFCQCPSTHTPNYDTQKCEIKIYDGVLSPTNISSSSSSDGCSKCKQANAICVKVSNETKCWCRSGYVKNGDTCEKETIRFVFPNDNDINQREYTSPNCSVMGNNWTVVANNKLCTCAKGSKIVVRTSICESIKPEWNGNDFEYGVCTRINSNGDAVQEDNLCPEPLKCEQRHDKYVCSCGRNKYLDEKDNTCYNFLDTDLIDTNSVKCPQNAKLNGTKCQCLYNGVYTMSNDKRRCELKLSNTETNSGCSPNATYDVDCAGLFNNFAEFCKQGECRCLSNSSYYYNGKCLQLLNIELDTNGTCPPNSERDNSACICSVGYQANGTNHTCARKVNQINETISSSDYNVTDADCQTLFPNQPVIASSTAMACICDTGAFLNNYTCYFNLTFTIPDVNASTVKCPEHASVDGDKCQCKAGYKNENDKHCVPFTNIVYPQDVIGINIPGIKAKDCEALFGNAANATDDDGYCTCVNQTAFNVGNTTCYFFLEVSIDSGNITGSDCPPNSQVNGDKCKCNVGYKPNESKQGCVRKEVYSTNLQSINKAAIESCNTTYNDADCIALHGSSAVCHNNTCYCDQSKSFVKDGRCVLYSTYVFPGIHEYSLYTCNSDADCGNNTTECGYNNNTSNYKVCKCKDGYFLNIQDGTCVKDQCSPKCSANQECKGYKCVCQIGYYANISGDCVKFDTTVKLYDNCSSTIWNTLRSNNEEFKCLQECERIACTDNYHEDGSTCVKNSFNDRCAHNTDVCLQFSPSSTCSLDENKCTCSIGYYRDGDTCALPVNARCNADAQCGVNKQCIGHLCTCNEDKKAEDTQDEYGRILQRCVNGVDQRKLNPVLLLFILLAYVFFA